MATFNPSSLIQNIPIFSIREDFPTPGLPLIPILKLSLFLLLSFSSKLNNSCASLECSLNLDSTKQESYCFISHSFSIVPKVMPRANEERSPFKIPSTNSLTLENKRDLFKNIRFRSSVCVCPISLAPCSSPCSLALLV